jgi:hypothetical protein
MTLHAPRLKRTCIRLLLLTLPAICFCLVAGELVFRFVVPACQFPDPVWDGQFQIYRLDTRGPRDGVFTIGRFARGGSRWHVNEQGWNSALDYREHRPPGVRRVALIGDSYVEALNVDVDRSVAAELRRLVPDNVEVYSFGIAGAPLSQYLQMSRYVARQYDPDVMVFNVVHNDFAESLATFKRVPYFLQFVPSGTGFSEIAPTPYRPSKLRRLLKKSAWGRYLAENLQIRRLWDDMRARRTTRRFSNNTEVVSGDRAKEEIEGVTRHIIGEWGKENRGRSLFLIMDAPRTELYSGQASHSPVLWLNRLAADVCREPVCHFVDLTSPFTDYWQRYHRHLENSYDWHWNERGHRLVAEVLYRRLVETGVIPGGK